MRGGAPYVVVLSSHLLFDLEEVIVAPLALGSLLAPSDFDLPVEVDGEPYKLSLTGMAAIRKRELRKSAGSLGAFELEIRRALDRLFTGF